MIRICISSMFILALVSTFLISCSIDSGDLVKRYASIYNTHDVDKMVALYADDAVFELTGQLSLSGKSQLRKITEYDVAMNIHMTISDINSKGDTVFCHVKETNDWIKEAGIDNAHYKAMFVYNAGLIKLIRAEATPEPQQAFEDVSSPLLKWARENEEDLLSEMMPEGKFVYNAENARKSLKLLRLWRESLKE